MRAILLLAAVAAVTADLSLIQWPQFLATMDCGTINLLSGNIEDDTSLAVLASDLGTTGCCSAAHMTGSQGACFVNNINGVTIVNMTYQGLNSAWTAAHLHGPGAAAPVDPFFSSEGPQVLATAWQNLTGTVNETTPCFTTGGGATPSGSCGVSEGSGVLSAAQLAYMGLAASNMNFYCNIHSSQFPNGEIRGQIYPATNRYMAACDPSQCGVPTSGSTGSCTAWCALSTPNGGTVTCGGQWFGLTGNVTAAHLHLPGPQGATSAPWNFLTTFSAGTLGLWGTMSGTQTLNSLPPTGQLPSFDPLVSIRADWSYVNVHTNRYPGGEVRGQLHMVNSDPQSFAPATPTSALSYFSTNGNCLPIAGTTMYWKGCAAISGTWQLSEYIGMYTDSQCTSLQSAQNRFSTLYNLGVHKLWLGMDVTKHGVSSVTAVSNSASDIAAWNAATGCQCSGTWAANVPRTVSGCTGTCTLTSTNFHAGVFNSTGYWFSTTSFPDAGDVLEYTNMTSGTSILGYYTTPTTTINSCTDYTALFHPSSAGSVGASALVVALAAVAAFIAARDA